MVKRLASATEVKNAMNDPVDLRTASNTAVFFVVFRLCMYIICFVPSMTAVISLAVENGDLLEQLKDFSAIPTASTKTTLTQKGENLDSVCAFEYFAIERKKNRNGDEVSCAMVADVYGRTPPGSSKYVTDQLAATPETTLRCNMVKGTLAVGTFYGFVMAVITALLIYGKKVKVSRSIIIEFVMAGLLMVLYLAMACMVQVRVGNSCDACIDANAKYWGSEPTCEEFAVIQAYRLRSQDPPTDEGYGNPDFKEWYSTMSTLKDGLWLGFAGWAILTWMLWIRFKNARTVAKSPEFNNTVQSEYNNLVEAPKGANAHAQDPQASPAPSYATNESAPPPPPAAQGNPFA
jgi:hypothetical protein